MPVHPSEEEAPSGIFEKVAKDPSSNTESTASDHEHHENEHTPQKASIQDIQSPGPVIPLTADDLPPKASKEELQARDAELNK
ncbi:hypothetical protein MMC29_001099 [Sticta canariensis]|nr:hypothetical protein [Sticta canariensis]